MRLINTKTLKLEEFQSNIPTYAILSHTWGDEEVSFVDWQSNFDEAKTKAGFDKVQRSCQQACYDGYQYLWCDTNCIDKRSSAELSEAINSMYTWYKNSAVCYAYLADVPHSDLSRFSSSRWFTRGWTLQELLAPRSLIFFTQDWSVLGTRTSLSKMVFKITKIEDDYMGDRLYNASISERMSWVSRRETSRIEDIAYCMLGIFDINMPLLYGEGPKAFIRLQEEIIRVSDDQSIFCWHWDGKYVPRNWTSMLSPSPRTFEHSGSYLTAPEMDDVIPYTMSNAGLSISLVVLTAPDPETTSPSFHPKSGGQENGRCLAVLRVFCRKASEPVGLALRRYGHSRRFVRLPFPLGPVPLRHMLNILPTTMCIAGSRDRGYFTGSLRNPGQAPEFGVFVVASYPNGIKGFVTTHPRPHPYFGTHALRPFGSECFGTVFSLETTINCQVTKICKTPISVTAIFFVGVRVQESEADWGCKVLEIHDTTTSTPDISERISHHELKIHGVVDNKPPLTNLELHYMSNRSDAELGIGMSMALGPSIKVSENSSMSVAHVCPSLLTRRLQEE